MKIILDKNKINFNYIKFTQTAGYAFIRDNRRGKESFVRRLGSGRYPRLHLYIKEQGNDIIFDLHVDQKEASYAGARMHNAEHEGEVVEAEINRLKQLMMAENNKNKIQKKVEETAKEKKGWFSRIFGK